MEYPYLVAFSSALLLSGIAVVPAHASTIVPCSIAGSFTVTGTVVSKTSPFGDSDCEGVAEIPASITEIDSEAFIDASALTSLIFQADSSLTVIRGSAFSGTGLTTLSIPDGVTTIENLAFGLLPSLGSVTFESGSKLTTIGIKAFGSNSALTSVTFRGMNAPSSVSADAFEGVPVGAKIYLEDGATGFGSVGDTWKGLVIASGGTIVTPDPAPVSYPAILVPVPPVTTPTPDITKSFFLNSPVLANQQKKELRKLVREVGEGSRFEVVVRELRVPGQTKKQANALALAKARAIKKYLVARGIKKKEVSLETEVYRIGTGPETKVLGFKPDISS